MDFDIPIQSNNQLIKLPFLENKKITLYLKREDTIHSLVSGNKFRKLKYNIQRAKQQQKNTLLTFGGAFSNHIVATAIAGNLNRFKTIGIIRGDELARDMDKTLSQNPSLQKAYTNGMEFLFVTREAYRNKNTESFTKQLEKQFGDFFLIPEGGNNAMGIKGCEEILTKEDIKFDYICCPVGTGTTMTGLINTAQKHQKIIGFSVLKENFLTNEINKLVGAEKNNWKLQREYHFGGYAKYNTRLISFINQFKKQTTVLLDPIYTGKMLYGIMDLIQKNQFSTNSKILAIHTGGIQGIAGINQKLRKKYQEIIKIE